MPRRRRLLVAAGALASVGVFPGDAAAQRQPTVEGALRLGVDRSLIDSGLARSLQRAFGADTGIAIILVGAPALAVLEAVNNGEVDCALTNAPGAEEGLAKQNLVHDRRPIATGRFMIVGPAKPPLVAPSKAAPKPARLSGAEALAHIRDLAAGPPGAATFLSAGDGSGVHVAEQGLWRAARIDPQAPWYATADPKRSFVAQVRERGAYALVERGAWAALGGAPLAVLVDGDPLLVEDVHAMRSFRVSHPAAKIFIAWIAGGRGRAVVARHSGYAKPA